MPGPSTPSPTLQEVAPHRRGTARGRRPAPARGKALCRRIYGPVYDRMIARMAGFHPDLADWILADGYGRVLSRPGCRSASAS